MNMKTCTACRKPFPLTEQHFKVARRNPDGFNSRCIPCYRLYARTWSRRRKAGLPTVGLTIELFGKPKGRRDIISGQGNDSSTIALDTYSNRASVIAGALGITEDEFNRRNWNE